MGTYDTAQICLNRHVITSSSSYSELKKNFCSQCGEKTITNCPACNARIKGDYHVESVIGFSKFHVPSFCDNCGQSYPWTERSKTAAYDLIHFSDTLTLEEKHELNNSIDDLLKNSPNKTIAELKFKKYVAKAGKEIANGLKDILVAVVSESVKKSIWG
jgi:hypothetical protein